MKKVGLFFGSFNPIHIGHLAIANYMYSFTELNEVWFIISPHNPLKEKSSLLDQNQRLYMVNIAIEDTPFLKASSIEFGLSQPSYTINTLAHLKEKYPDIEFCLILGSDNLHSFHKWKNYETILEKHDLFIYPRPSYEGSKFDTHQRVHFTNAPLIEISSTFIRDALKQRKNICHFLHPSVWRFIDEMNLYQK